MNSQELRALQEAYLDVYAEGFPAVKPSVRSGDAGTSGLKMIQTSGGGTGYINKHSGGNVLPSGTVNSIMKGDLMVKNKNQNQTTQVAHFDIFDVIKGHLLDEGYADTEQAAEAIMVNMSEDWRESIVEGIADRAANAVGHQRAGTLGDDDEIRKNQDATSASIGKMKRGSGAKVTPTLPGV